MVTLENPLRLQQERTPEPQILVIFGSGDLTQRKLVPALQMRRERRIPPETTIVGVARRD